jgi:predicted acylesterase/phospholipase RssA
MMALRELGIVPVALSGCSAGAIVAAFWAAGLAPTRVRDILLGTHLEDFIDPPTWSQLRQHPWGLLGGHRLEGLLEGYIPPKRVEDCVIPLSVSTFDLAQGELRYLDRGPLARAVRASAALPGMFMPAEVDGHPCWDGGVASRLPLHPLVQRADVDLVLACYLPRHRDNGRARTPMDAIRRVMESQVLQRDREELERAHRQRRPVVVVAPDVPPCGPWRMRDGPGIVARARSETRRILLDAQWGHEDFPASACHG